MGGLAWPRPTTDTKASSPPPSTRRLARSGALAGALAAVGTTVVAAVATAAGVNLEVDGTAIPIPAFAWWSIIIPALGRQLPAVD